MSNPLFSKEDIPSEREVVIEEYNRSIDSPSQFAFAEIQKDFFLGNHKHQILGNKKTIKSFTKSQLIEFRKKFYNRQNSLLVVAGDVTNRKKLTKTI